MKLALAAFLLATLWLNAAACSRTLPEWSYYNRNFSENMYVVDDWRDYSVRDPRPWKEETPK